MADFERLVQELIEAAVREGDAAATFTKPMQRYYNATRAARDALMGAIDKATRGVAVARQPLTDDEIAAIYVHFAQPGNEGASPRELLTAIVRKIEAAHGIGVFGTHSETFSGESPTERKKV